MKTKLFNHDKKICFESGLSIFSQMITRELHHGQHDGEQSLVMVLSTLGGKEHFIQFSMAQLTAYFAELGYSLSPVVYTPLNDRTEAPIYLFPPLENTCA